LTPIYVHAPRQQESLEAARLEELSRAETAGPRDACVERRSAEVCRCVGVSVCRCVGVSGDIRISVCARVWVGGRAAANPHTLIEEEEAGGELCVGCVLYEQLLKLKLYITIYYCNIYIYDCNVYITIHTNCLKRVNMDVLLMRTLSSRKVGLVYSAE